MNAHHLSRRLFLQGSLAGLALPAMPGLWRAGRREPPRRVVFIGNHLGFWPDGFFPQSEGTDYKISPTLKPIRRDRKDFTVFSHLDHGSSGGHRVVYNFLSGVTKEEAAGFPDRNVTLDQVLAEYTGNSTRFPSVRTAVGTGMEMSWNRSGVVLPPTNRPAQLFEALFVQGDATQRAKQRERLSRNASILDALAGSSKRVSSSLGCCQP